MTSIRYPHVAERVFNTPLLMMPEKLDAILFGLATRMGVPGDKVAPDVVAIARSLGIDPQAVARDIGAYTTYVGERKQPGYRVVDGVGVLDIFGALTHRGGFDANSTYFLGYQQVARMFDEAMNDADVHSIVLNMDSPGGEVGGVFDLAEHIYQSRGVKPINAVAGNLSASASYLLSAATDEISVTQTGWVGSVGVVMRHADFSQALKNDGIKVTHIFAGSHKVDGNPYEALPDDVRAKFQSEIDALYTMFVAAVSRYTGLSEEAVRGTEAQVFMGEAAVDARLAHRVETPDQLIARLAAVNGRSSIAKRGNQSMSDEKERDGGANQPDKQFSQADVDKARAEGKAEGVSIGATEERDRISGILTHEAAKGREQLASWLAFEADMSVETATAKLATAPIQQTLESKQGKSEFEKHMASFKTGVQAGSDDDGGEKTAAALVAEVLAL